MNVFVMCSWRDPRDAQGNTWAGTSLPALKGMSGPVVRAVTMPEDSVESTCAKDAHNCEQVLTPSRRVKTERSADLRVVRPAPDGGEAEVIVVFAVP
jgi:hypothetical protein